MLRLSIYRISLPFWVRGRLVSSTAILRLEQSSEERAREEELRRKVLQKCRGIQIPEATTHEYGHFSTMGINASVAQQAASNAGPQGCSGFGGDPLHNRRRVDWVMLLTGCMLVYFSEKILVRQFARGVNGLDMPLWTASVELQAKHLLFAVQFQQSEQDQLRKEFEAVRQTNPFVDFFEWVRSRRPEFCSGRKYEADYVMHTLVSYLRSGDGKHLGTVARTLQQSMTRKSADSCQRVDDFVEGLHSVGFLFQGLRGVASSSMHTPDYSPRLMYASASEAGEYVAQESDLTSALDVKNGEAHSSTPFSEKRQYPTGVMESKSANNASGGMGTIMPRVSHDKVAELKEAFFILDSNGSATVSASDVKELFSSAVSGRLEKVISDILKECSVDGKGPLTFAQFFCLVTKLSEMPALTKDEAEKDFSAAYLCAAFAPFDPDDTGMVDSRIFFLLMGEKENKLSLQEQENLRLRLERTGHMKNGRVHYKAFVGNLVATNINTPYF